jgi:phage tail-like protein
VIVGSLKINIGDDPTDWIEVNNFGSSGPDDRHYILDKTAGIISFGDGIHGKIPPKGKNNIKITFRSNNESYEKEGYYKPEPLDSGIADCNWHRITIDADIPDNTYLEIRVQTSVEYKEAFSSSESAGIQVTLSHKPVIVGSLEISIGNDVWTEKPNFISSGTEDRHYVLDPIAGIVSFGDGIHGKIPPKGKNNIKITYKSYTSYKFQGNVRDQLVQSTPDRYITLEIYFHGDNRDSSLSYSKVTPTLRQVKIYYPRESYLRYLPAIYQDDDDSKDFLERFLSVFESMLYVSEETISNLPSYFDPQSTPDGFMEWLASWLALDRYELLGDKNREFILRAVEFYKQKGTASGLANLVSFLTGLDCCAKEYMNNVFRSYGREHKEAHFEIGCDNRCTRFFHDISKTVDTADSLVLEQIGSYEDRTHYTFDLSAEGKYSSHVVGLFIFIKQGEKLLINQDELKKIIDAFLPVFIRVYITTVESFDEVYYLDSIYEFYEDNVYDRNSPGEDELKLTDISGSYMDTANFEWLITNLIVAGEWIKITNSRHYRTSHSCIIPSNPPRPPKIENYVKPI